MEAKIRKKAIEIGTGNTPAEKKIAENKPLEIDLFSSGKNIDFQLVEKVKQNIKDAHNIKIKGAEDFNVLVSKDYYSVDLETFAYIRDTFAFQKAQGYANRLCAILKINDCIKIEINSVPIDFDVFTKTN